MADIDLQDDMTLKPGIGIGNIRFGLTPIEIKDLLSPTYREWSEEETHAIEYLDGSVCFFFDESEGGRLSSIEVTNHDSIFFGEAIFLRAASKAVGLAESFCLNYDLTKESTVEDLNTEEREVYFPGLCTHFYFDKKGQLASIHLGLFFNNTDEVAWPSEEAVLSESGMRLFYQTYRGAPLKN